MSFSFGFALPALVQYGGGISNPLGFSLDLWFANMDQSYTTGPTLDLNFTTQTYQQWALPAVIQGTYIIYEGIAPWEPNLNLDFINQAYQQAV